MNYIYSGVGRSYLKPLNTRFLFIGTNSSDVSVFLVYGNRNINDGAILTASLGAALTGLALLLL